MLDATLLHTVAPVIALAGASGIDGITPDYSFPVFTLIKQIVSWLLGGGLILVYGALILGILLVIFKGFGNERARAVATANIGYIIMGTLLLSGITGVWNWIVGMDLGFGK